MKFPTSIDIKNGETLHASIGAESVTAYESASAFYDAMKDDPAYSVFAEPNREKEMTRIYGEATEKMAKHEADEAEKDAKVEQKRLDSIAESKQRLADATGGKSASTDTTSNATDTKVDNGAGKDVKAEGGNAKK